MNKNFRCVLAVAHCEYIKWVTNPRMLIVAVFLIFMKVLAIEPLLERAAKFENTMDILEPYIAIGNSRVLIMFMPCVFIMLIGDYPKMTGNTLFLIKRTGKMNWFMGQILFIICAMLTYLSVILLGTIALSRGTCSGHWSDAVTKYDYYFPEEYGSFASQFLPSNLYNQLTLLEALALTTVLVIAYMFILSLIIYYFKLIHIHSFGLLAAFFVVAMGVVTCSVNSKIMWCFPMANSIVWLHYDEILSEKTFPLIGSYLYYLIIIILLLVINVRAVKKYNFTNIEQVE